MRTKLIAALLFSLCAVAEAGRGGHHGGGMAMRGGGYSGGGRVVVRHAPAAVYRRDVVVQRYTDQRIRPPIYAERYAPRPGYYWVPGSWQWNGAEWMWVPGRYEPDPNYRVVPAYRPY